MTAGGRRLTALPPIDARRGSVVCRQVDVYFVDYGNTDVVPYSSLREIGSDSRLMSLPWQVGPRPSPPLPLILLPPLIHPPRHPQSCASVYSQVLRIKMTLILKTLFSFFSIFRPRLGSTSTVEVSLAVLSRATRFPYEKVGATAAVWRRERGGDTVYQPIKQGMIGHVDSENVIFVF